MEWIGLAIRELNLRFQRGMQQQTFMAAAASGLQRNGKWGFAERVEWTRMTGMNAPTWRRMESAISPCGRQQRCTHGDMLMLDTVPGTTESRGGHLFRR